MKLVGLPVNMVQICYGREIGDKGLVREHRGEQFITYCLYEQSYGYSAGQPLYQLAS